jgi:hypothetical protein
MFFTSCALITGCRTTATVHSWTQATKPAEFPESVLGLPSTGVCFSGGGTRAMNCALGQMKGLDSAKLWDHIGYVSAVSGGSWATSIFTYYIAGAENDKELLGTIIPPEKITMDTLNYMPKGFMGNVISKGFGIDFFERWGLSLITKGLLQKMDNIWIDAVGNTYLKEFGLYDPEKPAYFTLNDSTRDDILRRNTKLKAEDFITVHKRKDGDFKRPFMIINSSLLAPAKDLPLRNPENLSVFNYTPLYIGSNNPLQVSDKNLIFGNTVQFNAGGGFVESFGFGGNYLKDKINLKKSNEYTIRVKLPRDRFRLVDATGTSSAAFGASISSSIIAQIPPLKGLALDNMIPEQEYWPIKTNGDFGTTEKYRFTDGGNLENYGLITLLQREVKKIVVFINTNTPLIVNSSSDKNCPVDLSSMDSDLYPLFGFLPAGNQINNQVFDSNYLSTVYNGLREAKIKGGTVMAKTRLTVKENTWWGIKGGNSVEILWVYNEYVNDWVCQLSDSVKTEVTKGSTGIFPDFPLYKLIFEDGLTKGISLTKPQINLLYQLSAWNVYHNKKVFDFLKDEK